MRTKTYDAPGSPMHGWPVQRRETGLLEARCAHGVGHPIPESAAALDKFLKHKPGTWSVHGCDGCCFGRRIGDDQGTP